MFDKEISHYNVIIYDYVSSKGGYRKLKTLKCGTEEEAVKIAKEYIADTTIKYQVKIEQVCSIINWWED